MSVTSAVQDKPVTVDQHATQLVEHIDNSMVDLVLTDVERDDIEKRVSNAMRDLGSKDQLLFLRQIHGYLQAQDKELKQLLDNPQKDQKQAKEADNAFREVLKTYYGEVQERLADKLGKEQWSTLLKDAIKEIKEERKYLSKGDEATARSKSSAEFLVAYATALAHNDDVDDGKPVTDKEASRFAAAAGVIFSQARTALERADFLEAARVAVKRDPTLAPFTNSLDQAFGDQALEGSLKALDELKPIRPGVIGRGITAMARSGKGVYDTEGIRTSRQALELFETYVSHAKRSDNKINESEMEGLSLYIEQVVAKLQNSEHNPTFNVSHFLTGAWAIVQDSNDPGGGNYWAQELQKGIEAEVPGPDQILAEIDLSRPRQIQGTGKRATEIVQHYFYMKYGNQEGFYRMTDDEQKAFNILMKDAIERVDSRPGPSNELVTAVNGYLKSHSPYCWDHFSKVLRRET
ncbi:hypothetical protein ACFL6C_00430 [Myxococcota bacterium]